jgi:hypothetical protein
MPVYVAVPLALLASVIAASALALVGAFTLNFILGKLLQNRDALGYAITAFFLFAPGIALLAFVSSFSVFVNWHHAASWQAPTFTFATGAVLVWLWARNFGGVGLVWYMPGTIAWLASCWLLRKKGDPIPEHVV